MKPRRLISFAIALLAAGLLAQPSFGEVTPPRPTQKPTSAAKATPKAGKPAETTTATAQPGLLPRATPKGGTIILMRGLANVWSRGMDTMAKKFEAQGLNVTLVNHGLWRKLSDKLLADYKADKATAPIIIIGHSLGGDAALVMSNWLGLNKTRVRFVVVFDAVAQTHPIIGTVDEVLNYYKPSGYGQEVKPGRGFNGTLTNIDLSKRPDIGHLNIDKDVALQDEVIAKVFEILELKPPKTETKPKAAAKS